MKNRYEIRGDISVIFLNKRDGSSLETVIDTADLEKVKSFPGTWYSGLNSSTKTYYAKASLKDKSTVWLHRYIMDAPEDKLIDHRDQDTLNNRRYNLRPATHAENMQNKRKSTSASGERGITWVPHAQKWRVRVGFQGKQYYGGLFLTKEEAVEAARQLRSELLPFSTN